MSLLEGLNPAQQQAAQHVNGPLLVVAGAGSGKTKTLTVRIAYLLDHGVAPYEILAVTFTNKAAKEMSNRIKSLLGHSEENPVKIPQIGTFHSIGVKILRREMGVLERGTNFTIFDTTDTQALARTLLKDRNIPAAVLNPRTVLGMISNWKNEMVSPEKALASSQNRREQMVAEIYEAYQKQLHSTNAVDFDDLILLPVKIFQRSPETLEKYQKWWKYIMIDEYQDTNYLQYLFAKMIAQEHRNICAIGDSDQSIYKFRGADLSNIMNFQKEYEDSVLVKLEQNYRSSKNILDAADAVISQNSNRIPKKMVTVKDEGVPLNIEEYGDEREEADFIFAEIGKMHADGKKLSEIAILYRTNAQSRSLEEASLRHAVPYTIVGGLKFYARAEVKDILGYLRIILNPDDAVSLERVINVPARKIGKTSIDRLKGFALSQNMELGRVLDHLNLAEGIPTAAKTQMIKFNEMLHLLRASVLTKPLSEFLKEVIDKTGYKKMLESNGEEGQVRLENIRELVSVAQKYDQVDPARALSLFLEEVALVSDVDKLDESTEKVTLMTLHSSKGLEFPTVFMPGCEENIFPSSRAMFQEDDLEEERRLMYVGITRAEEELRLSCCKSRMLYGDIQYNGPSRFLSEIPEELCDGNYFADKSFASSFSDDRISYEVESSSEYSVGEIVEHKTFGLGKIISQEGDILTILFQNHGEKRLVGSIAPLEKRDPDFL